ncbi:MAG: hypothetical protein WCH43_06860, partial [Verrucomicrobiota bacterium]
MTQSVNANTTSSSLGLENLKLDFYESGQGDTIIITFPGGGLGVVDAHPSPTHSRPEILEILSQRQLHFVCLTHPHADHGRDLVPVLEQHPDVAEFWHTNSDISAFIYRLREMPNWPSEVREFARQMGSGWANFLIDLYGAVAERGLPIHQVRAGDEVRHYDGVEVHALAPEEVIQQEFLRYWMGKAGDPTVQKPDPNLLSAVLALRWGDSVVLLGADAVRSNWCTAVKRYQKLKLPKAVVLKVPHHGANNSIDLRSGSKEPGFLDICLHSERRCMSVLFAGDSKHPNAKVYERLLARTDVHCLNNGIRGRRIGPDLGIELEGA